MISLFILIAVVKSQEIPNRSHQLAPTHFNYHSNPVRQYLEEISPEPTKNGPVLFPNDAPPPPKPPLVVTSRPLAESIARSELNNSIADSSYISPVTYRPSFGSYNSLGYTNQQPAEQYNTGVSSEQDYSEGQNYAFSYIVKDQKNGDDFSHKQQSVGSATNGEYRVRLPDGRLQIVSYTADDNGYKANVRYDEQPVDNPIYQSNVNYVDNAHNEFQKPTYSVNNLDNSNYDFSKVNYRDEIPVKENQYDSKEYYDYSAENYKNAELYNPVSTVSPYVQENYQSTVAPYQQISHTTAAPYYQQNLYTSTAPFQYNSQLFQVNTTPSSSTTVRPAYEEIKHLFTTPNYKNIEINSPSSYSADDFVLIGNKNSYNYDLGLNQGLVSSTPASYIASSLSNLNDRINSKPVLSNSYIDRINKYLSFK